MAKPQVSYLQTRLKTASPEELTIITFDVLITSTTRAVAGLKAAVLDIQAVHNDLRRGQRAASLLMGSLNMEIDKELGARLFSLYEFWHHELYMANMKKSPTAIEQLLPQMKSLRETWVEANKRYRAEKVVPVNRNDGGFVAVG
jgi:flagellar biosynthetic protein FliS